MKSKRVLIVDDNDLNRALFENLIGQQFSIESAKNGLEALEWAKNTEFHLILMDIQMPLMDGITAMKKIRNETTSTCPILAVTAYAGESDRGSFLAQGFDDFITKPIRPREFLQLVHSYLKTQSIAKPTERVEQVETKILDRAIIDQLLKYHSRQSIQKIFEDFLMECEELEQAIDAHIPYSSAVGLMEKIHMLKGNSGTLGVMGVFRTALKSEEHGRSQQTEEFEKEIKILRNEIRQFRIFFNQEPIFES
ncbi:hypothetical protein GCM10009119_41770 [Algoriphagus jejuensis]|uniref:Hpt domain-containing protein n=1 Tax=Algoriphagus jejuensis TaxID=419934 RepID=A0ABN1N5H6_9BACT